MRVRIGVFGRNGLVVFGLCSVVVTVGVIIQDLTNEPIVDVTGSGGGIMRCRSGGD